MACQENMIIHAQFRIIVTLLLAIACLIHITTIQFTEICLKILKTNYGQLRPFTIVTIFL